MFFAQLGQADCAAGVGVAWAEQALSASADSKMSSNILFMAG